MHEIIITAIIIVLFLLHIRSSFVVAICLPAAVLMSFILATARRRRGWNLMSLAGIAIAIGTMVDMGIIVSENIYQHLADWKKGVGSGESGAGRLHQSPSLPTPTSSTPNSSTKKRSEIVYEATIEVAPAVVTAVATTIVSFLPVFFLTGRDYRLFSPLAYTKTFAIAAAMITAVTLVPALSRLFLKSRQLSQVDGTCVGTIVRRVGSCDFALHVGRRSRNPFRYRALDRYRVSRTARIRIRMATAARTYSPHRRDSDQSTHSLDLRGPIKPTPCSIKAFALSFPVLLLFVGVGAFFGMPIILQPVEKVARVFGAELNDFPGYVDAKHVFTGLQSDDWIALDEGSWFYMPTLYPAASFSQAMQVLQTQDVLIGQIPEVKDVMGKIGRVESALDPAPAAMVETYVMLKPESEWREGVTARDVWDEINRVATLPGVTPAAALQPIEGRVVMLQSGIKAPMAIRVYGDDLTTLASAAMDVAAQLKKSSYVNAGTVNPDIVLGKPYIEFTVNRDAASRYGMSASMVNQVIETARAV